MRGARVCVRDRAQYGCCMYVCVLKIVRMFILLECIHVLEYNAVCVIDRGSTRGVCARKKEHSMSGARVYVGQRVCVCMCVRECVCVYTG